MRRIITIINLLAIIAFGGSCATEDIPQDVNTLGVGSYVKLVEKNAGIIDATNPAGSTATIKVSEYGIEQEKVVVYVSKGNRTADRSKWKLIKEVPATAAREYDIAVTGAEIVAAMGAPVAPGEVYTLYNSCITKDGGRFDLGNINGEVAGNPNYNMALTWQATVVCPFVPTGFAGQFIVEEDAWGDYSVGEEVTVNSANTSGLVMTVFPSDFYGAVNRQPVTVNIEASTGVATVTNQIYGDYPQFGLVGMRLNTSGTNNYVFSCVGTITLFMNHTGTVSGGNQGSYLLRLKKK